MKKNYISVTLIMGIILLFSSHVIAGPNENAGIRFDLNATTYGNQNQTSMSPPSVGAYIRLDVYAINVHNLDTYEFEINYNQTQLSFIGAYATNPITHEPNILTSDGGTAVGFMVDTSTPGVLSIAYTLTGTDTTQAPEGEGLIADVEFQTLTTEQGSLTFGQVKYYDSSGVMDIITDKDVATLPVELAAFTATYVAENGYTSICWTTASETDVIGFNIYRNTDNEFDTAAKLNGVLIPGHGTTTEPNDYEFIDSDHLEFEVTYYYWLQSVDLGGETQVYSSISLTPEQGSGEFVNKFDENKLVNHPNPFSSSTTIEYAIKGMLKAEPVELRIYNSIGQLVDIIEGKYGKAEWNTDKLTTGVYFYQLKTESYTEVKKMMVIK